MSHKPALPLPFSVVELQTTGSTNDHAKQLAREGAPSGVVVWAHMQTAGRGRQGNGWISRRGNLFMSMILRPRVRATDIGQLSFLTAVALANAFESIVSVSDKIQLKWPNDVLVNQKKAAGILIETESQGENTAPWVVAGIGVNITSAPENAISLHDIDVETDAGYMLEIIVREMQSLLLSWERDGFENVRQAWLARAYRLNEDITARLPRETLTGRFEGLDSTGALLLKLPDGEEKVIASGEVFLS